MRALVPVCGVALASLAVVLHFYAFSVAERWMARPWRRPHRRVVAVVVVAVAAHLAEVVAFGLGWWALERAGLVALSTPSASLLDAVYFSGVTYTSLGYGEVVPLGAGRLLAVLEAVVGLVLIAWTASFTFLTMQRDWEPQAGEA